MAKRVRQLHEKRVSYEQAWGTYKAFTRGRSSRAALAAAIEALQYHSRGSVVARLLLATVLSDKETPFFDPRRATTHYARCVRQGLPEAAAMLASDYSGWGALSRNLSRRYYWLMEGRKLGSAECTFFAGLALLAGRGVRRDESKGRDLIREAVDYPDARAVAALLDMQDPRAHERRRAMKQLDRAAELGSPEAWLMQGVLVQSGLMKGVAASPVEHYRRAARAGKCAAMWNLHVCHAAGLGVRRSPSKARYWRRRSGENVTYQLESGREVGVYAWGRTRIYPLPMAGPLALSSYEEMSAVVGNESFAARKAAK